MPNSFTPQQIEEFLQEFFDVVGARQYIGARYVPIFGRKGEGTVEWDDGAPYEPLTVVMHLGVSYVSRQYVPAGTPITDTDFWVETYRFNAQVEQYRQEVLGFQDQIDQIRDDMESGYVPFPDSASYPKYGVLGQVLTTLTGGETKWEDPVTVDAEIAEPLINEWLDDHPEATTTVLDGSITNAKMATAKNALLQTALKSIGFCFGSGNQLTSLDDAPPNTIIWMQVVSSNLPANMPITSNLPSMGILVTIELDNSTARQQYYICLNKATHFARNKTSGGVWNNWNTINIDDNSTTDKPWSAAKIIQYVATAIGVPIRINQNPITSGTQNLLDYNDADANTIYCCNYAASAVLPANYPTPTPILNNTYLFTLAINGNTNVRAQFYYDLDNNVIWRRRRYKNNDVFVWTQWVNDEQTDEQTYFVCSKDGTGDFTSLVTAINTVTQTENATLYVGPGTWDIVSELGSEYVESVSSTQRGLYLQNGIHVICSSKAKITCNYTGSNQSTMEWLSAFNSGPKGFTLENANIESSNVRYTIHDERGDQATDHYDNVYINCTFTHNNGFYEQCIGGGLGIDGHVRIIGCVFKTNNTNANYLLSYHNSADGAYSPDTQTPKQAKSFVEITNNYIEQGSINIIKLGMSQAISEVIITNNSLAAQVLVSQSQTLYHYDNVQVMQWNNEIRDA